MDYRIRPARADDKDAIVAFTQDTFSWGDYVPRVLDDWLAEPDAALFVADSDDGPVAVARGVMLSPTEAWFQGARVHPEWRRLGIGLSLHAALCEWARDRGGLVARLLIEDDNVAACRQVEAAGMRNVATFVRAGRSVGDASPVPGGNGGRRVGAMEKLRRAHSSEAQPAYLSWSTGELARAARGLFGRGWQFRRLEIDDLHQAALDEELWAARSGWVLGRREAALMEIGWLEAGRDDAHDLLRAVVDLAVDEGAEEVRALLPDIGWLNSAARRANYSLLGERLYESEL